MLILAVGIGVNAAVFTVVSATLFKGFRLVDRADRLVYVHSTNDGQYSGVSYPDFLDWQHEATSFDGGMGLVGDLKVLCDDREGAPEVCDATRITAHGFQLLGREPMLGRGFVPSDDVPGAAPVAVLSYAFWDRRFGRDPLVIGKTLRLRSADGPAARATRGSPLTTIVGVMPQHFAFPQNEDFWVPLVPNTPDLEQRDARSEWFAFGRLAPGATRESAQAELATIGRRLAHAYPRSNRDESPKVESFAEFFVDRNAPVIYETLWAAVSFVLLIACANLGSLCLARATVRAREMSIRAAIGAGRWRIVRQLLTESLVLSTIGGAGGWMIGQWAVRLYAVTTNPAIDAWNHNLLDYSVDARTFAYVLVLSVATGVLFGLAPALWLSRADLNSVMKGAVGGFAGGRHGHRVSSLLVVAEVSLAMVLIVGAGLMLRSCLRMYTAPIGAQTADMADMLLRLPAARYADREQQASFFDRLVTNIDAVPGVAASALGPTPAASNGERLTPYEVYEAPTGEGPRRSAAVAVIGPGYFRTLDTAVLSGREFTRADRASSPPVAIVNERFARQQWPNTSAIGRRVRLARGDDPGQWLTIVGVVGDVMYDLRHLQITPMVYLPYAQPSGPADPWLLVRTTVAPATLLHDLRRRVNALDADVLVWLGPEVVADRFASAAYGRTGRETALLIVFAAIALLLAAIGLYAVVAHGVSQRIQEIGVRTAMGATAHDIRLMVFRQGMVPAAIGLAIGGATALAVSPVLRSQLVGVVPTDPASFIAGAAVLIAAAMLGCTVPARRATRIDPVVALRRE